MQDRPDYIVDSGDRAPSFMTKDTDPSGKGEDLKSQYTNSKTSFASSEDDGMAVALGTKAEGKRAHSDFFRYFSQWRHLKILIGTCMCWFCVDIAFYGVNLNQSAILTAINFTAEETWRKLFKQALGSARSTHRPAYMHACAPCTTWGQINQAQCAAG